MGVSNYVRRKEVNLMSNKLSEIQNRQHKVEKLKEKIQKEVTDLRSSLQLHPHSEDKTQILELSYLYAIEDYINDENSFNYYLCDEYMNPINSISTLYDSRDPIAVMTKKVISTIPFFNQYTDKEKDNLGKNSSKLFTLNNIYKANLRIIGKVEEATDGDLRFLCSYWETVVENIVEWQELIRKEIYKNDLKQHYILCLNVTISAFGKLGAYFYERKTDDFTKILNKLRYINWSRENMKDWGGRVIGKNGKILSSETSVTLICNKLKMFLGIALTDNENKKELEVNK